jgi:hypothetical protein
VPPEYVIVAGAPHTFDLHPKGKSWSRTTVRLATNGNMTVVEAKSDVADLTAPALDFLARTIGK